MILGQLGGLTALAEEQESIHIEEPLELTDEKDEEVEDFQFHPENEEIVHEALPIETDGVADYKDSDLDSYN